MARTPAHLFPRRAPPPPLVRPQSAALGFISGAAQTLQEAYVFVASFILGSVMARVRGRGSGSSGSSSGGSSGWGKKGGELG